MPTRENEETNGIVSQVVIFFVSWLFSHHGIVQASDTMIHMNACF